MKIVYIIKNYFIFIISLDELIALNDLGDKLRVSGTIWNKKGVQIGGHNRNRLP